MHLPVQNKLSQEPVHWQETVPRSTSQVLHLQKAGKRYLVNPPCLS
jgi:hypothetical protein